MWNRIGEAGGLVLAPALTSDNKRISEFLGKSLMCIKDICIMGNLFSPLLIVYVYS